MQRMSRGTDHWHLNVNGLELPTTQCNLRRMWKKWFSWETTKGDLFSKFQKEQLFVKKKNPPALRRRSHTHIVALRSPQAREGFLAQKRHVSNNIDAITLESFQMPTPTLELSTAKGNVVKSATAECTTALDMPSLHSSVLESTTTAVTASVLGRRVIRTRLSWAASRGALGRQGRTPGLARCSNERPGMMAHGDRTSRQVTKHPGRGTRCSNNIDATASLRVRPSSIKLKSFHLSSATAAGGGPRSGATSLCMMALDVPNFHMWSKRQNPDHVRCCWPSPESPRGPQPDAFARWWHPGSRNEDCSLLDRIIARMLCENTVAIEDGTKVLKGPPSASGTETSLSGWGTFHEWMQRRVARFWQTLQFLDRTAPHARSDHTRGERAYWCKLRLTLQCVKAPGSISLWKIWISWTSWKNPHYRFKNFEKTSFSTDFFAEEKVKLCAELLLWSSLPVLKNILLRLLRKLFYDLLFLLNFVFVNVSFLKKLFSWTLNFFYLHLIFFFIFCLKKTNSSPVFQLSFEFSVFFCVIFRPKQSSNKSIFFSKKMFLQTFLNFFGRGTYFEQKLFKNYHLISSLK